eukprot:CAMPEP_0117452664 /NCGR_PEP_ID=MMETSP0759-20121206/9751_1 /TAXON_ID=63605 /ORGANISM="Percolomonas cosmopolitus, Strain WS" /LENGTH=302 /DNA_ID=CAMNT_0005245525 /DNA_START=117 /DNA_END=1025 /DNA_ORIENTATION=-
MELSILCNCEINLVVFADDKLYEYTTDDPRIILEKYCERASEPHERYSNEDYWKKFDKTGGSADSVDDSKKSPAKGKNGKPATSNGSAKKKANKKPTESSDASQNKSSTSTTTTPAKSSTSAKKGTQQNGTSPKNTTSSRKQTPRTMEEIIESLPPAQGQAAGTPTHAKKAHATKSVAKTAARIAPAPDRLHPPASRHKRKRALEPDSAIQRANKKRKHGLHGDLTVAIPDVEAARANASGLTGGTNSDTTQGLSVNLETPSESATPTLFSDPTASPVTTPLSSMTATSSKLDNLEWPDAPK